MNQQTVSKWEQAKAVPRPQRIRKLAEVLRADVSDLMRYAGYLPEGEPPGAQADAPFHRLLGQVGLTNEQLIVLIEPAWEEYRGRLGSAWRIPVDNRQGPQLRRAGP